nr:unnamed protein product [Callosobruchus analis]
MTERSLVGHFADFSDLIQSNRYDIVAVSETWLNSNVDGPAVQINNYNFVRRDRNDGSRGGGLGIYIKNYIKYEILSQSDNTEDVWTGQDEEEETKNGKSEAVVESRAEDEQEWELKEDEEKEKLEER